MEPSQGTSSLIASDKVQGTNVYQRPGTAGLDPRPQIDQLSGKVAYAIHVVQRVPGIGNKYYPLPWSVLTHLCLRLVAIVFEPLTSTGNLLRRE